MRKEVATQGESRVGGAEARPQFDVTVIFCAGQKPTGKYRKKPGFASWSRWVPTDLSDYDISGQLGGHLRVLAGILTVANGDTKNLIYTGGRNDKTAEANGVSLDELPFEGNVYRDQTRRTIHLIREHGLDPRLTDIPDPVIDVEIQSNDSESSARRIVGMLRDSNAERVLFVSSARHLPRVAGDVTEALHEAFLTDGYLITPTFRPAEAICLSDNRVRYEPIIREWMNPRTNQQALLREIREKNGLIEKKAGKYRKTEKESVPLSLTDIKTIFLNAMALYNARAFKDGVTQLHGGNAIRELDVTDKEGTTLSLQRSMGYAARYLGAYIDDPELLIQAWNSLGVVTDPHGETVTAERGKTAFALVYIEEHAGRKNAVTKTPPFSGNAFNLFGDGYNPPLDMNEILERIKDPKSKSNIWVKVSGIDTTERSAELTRLRQVVYLLYENFGKQTKEICALTGESSSDVGHSLQWLSEHHLIKRWKNERPEKTGHKKSRYEYGRDEVSSNRRRNLIATVQQAKSIMTVNEIAAALQCDPQKIYNDLHALKQQYGIALEIKDNKSRADKEATDSTPKTGFDYGRDEATSERRRKLMAAVKLAEGEITVNDLVTALGADKRHIIYHDIYALQTRYGIDLKIKGSKGASGSTPKTKYEYGRDEVASNRRRNLIATVQLAGGDITVSELVTALGVDDPQTIHNDLHTLRTRYGLELEIKDTRGRK
jgi:hypothetical protein